MSFSGKVVGIGVETKDGFKNRAGRPGSEFFRAGENDSRPVVGFHQSGCDDAYDAFVPLLIIDDDGSALV